MAAHEETARDGTAPATPGSGAARRPGLARPRVTDSNDSFEAFFAAQHDRVARSLALAIGDEHLGRDAAAEGFTRALQRWRKVSRYDNPTGWVYRVGLNWARSRARKTRRELAPDVVGEAADPRATFPEVDPRLIPALRTLSDDHRAVVVGRFYLDMSEAELAEALGVRPGTIKSRLSRALAHLSEMLT